MSQFTATSLDERNRRIEWLFKTLFFMMTIILIVPVIIVPIVVLGRRLRALSRENQDWIAASSGTASETLLSVQSVGLYPRRRQPPGLFRSD